MKTFCAYIKILSVIGLQFLFSPTALMAQSPPVSGRIENPLKADSITGPNGLINDLINAVQIIVAPLIVIFVIYAGFLFVTARGNDRKLETAKKTLLYVLIGAAIILGAEVLSTLIENTADNLTN